MVFYCQRHCYEKEYTTQVLSSKPSKVEVVVDGKKKKVDCYETIFEDTVFFPEGGGQPDDHGTAGDVGVMRVLRRGDQAVHYLEGPLEEGASIIQQLDWSRRYDHMQQHTAQHLITAITETMYDYPTTSWNLGEMVSHIELNTESVTTAAMMSIETRVNQCIREATPVSIVEYDPADPKLKEIRTRGLPDDVCGPVRVVSIEGIDANLCCGTHVSNLAHLQAVKLLHTERGKANKTLLYFVAGDRLLRYLGSCVDRERRLNSLLHSNPTDHTRLVEKNQSNLKVAQKSLRETQKDLAEMVAQKFLTQDPLPSVFFHHRRDGDLEYLGAIVNAIDNESVLKVMTAGDDKDPCGSLVIHGPPTTVAQVAPRVCEILEGRGGGKTRFTAKVTRLGKRGEAEQYIRSVLQGKETEV